MAALIRSAKSGSDWTPNELAAFNITVRHVDVQQFFGVAQLPAPTVAPVILNHGDRPNGQLSKTERQFFSRLNNASFHPVDVESTVGDFAKMLLEMLNFDDENLVVERLVRSRVEMTFIMCGQKAWAKADLVLAEQPSQFILLVAEDKVSIVGFLSIQG